MTTINVPSHGHDGIGIEDCLVPAFSAQMSLELNEVLNDKNG